MVEEIEMSNRRTDSDADKRAALARLRRARRERLRLNEAWQQVQAFVPRDEVEEHNRQWLTSLLGWVEAWCDPGEAGEEEDFEEARESLEIYRWLFAPEDPSSPFELEPELREVDP